MINEILTKQIKIFKQFYLENVQINLNFVIRKKIYKIKII